MSQVTGKERLLMIQPTDAPVGADGYLFGSQNEHTHSIENELTDEQTKSGRVLGYGQNSESFEASFYAMRGDKGQMAAKEAIKKKKQVKIWDIDTRISGGQHDATFAYGLVESYEESAGEGFVELSTTIQVIGESQEGKIPELPESVLKLAQYDFEAPGETTGEFTGLSPDAPVGAMSLNAMTVAELRTVAKENDVTGYSNLTKEELVTAIEESTQPTQV